MSVYLKRLLVLESALLIGVAVCPALAAQRTKKSPAKPAAKSNAPSRRATAHASSHSGRLVLAADKKKTKGKKRKRAANWRSRGQQKIDAQRTRDIQDALVREHYLDGPSSGVWDDKSQKAMQKFQADNGWQSKMTPDSRALIKLGLGPDHAHLLNPESAMTTAPDSRPAQASSKAADTLQNTSTVPVMEQAPSSRNLAPSAHPSTANNPTKK